jgi:hypothetical protein
MAALIFATEKEASTLSRRARAKKLRRLARGLYTAELRSDPAQLVRAHWAEILPHYFPGAIVADRSVPRAGPDDSGHLFIIHSRERPLKLPGLVIIPRRGAGPLHDDIAVGPKFWVSSAARALAENLRPSRSVKGRPRRTLSERELHDWVARLRRVEGAERLNKIRDRAKEIARELGLSAEAIDGIVGAALGTRAVETQSPALHAAQRGSPFDERREALFEDLAEALLIRAPSPRVVLDRDRARQKFLPFFEAYFSNFIEGTEFTVDEAADIVFNGAMPEARPADAHDVLGTYAVVSDEGDMRRRPTSARELVELLKSRHARVLGGRPEKNPGVFKSRANRAGSTEFVAPDLVEGTLARGFELGRPLEDPFARAVFMMFLVAEVHPFDDGNGRVARIMMNAELHARDEHRVIIPSVFRNEYLAGLRAMTHNRNAGPMSRVLDFAQRYTAQIDFATLDGASHQLEATNAFVDPNEAAERGVKLTLASVAT